LGNGKQCCGLGKTTELGHADEMVELLQVHRRLRYPILYPDSC
jgi:hypothetical protein